MSLLGHNVVLMSNHQTEADPAIIALLLERSNPRISENMAIGLLLIRFARHLAWEGT